MAVPLRYRRMVVYIAKNPEKLAPWLNTLDVFTAVSDRSWPDNTQSALDNQPFLAAIRPSIRCISVAT